MPKETGPDQSVSWFRQASPYINAHRGKVFVIGFGGEVIAAADFSSLIHDIALLSHLGIRLVLVYGIRAQIAEREQREKAYSRIVNDLRVTDDRALQTAIEVSGSVRARIESAFSASLPNTPMSGSRLGVVSGNFVTGRPYGIHDGVDYCHTGVVRRVHAKAIHGQLEKGNIVLLSPLGYSITGEVFNLHAEDVATEAATALKADKLIFLMDQPVRQQADNSLLRQITPAEMQALIAQNALDTGQRNLMKNAIRACHDGIKRVHLLDRHVDGALLKELFTRDGIGTMVSADKYDDMRAADIRDVGGIIELIEPLESDGTLVRRSREQLEMEIANFTVIERDGTIVACAALYRLEDYGEVACVATHPEYRKSGHAENLLDHLEKSAVDAGLKRLYILTTRSRHWFIERGFVSASLDDLPSSRQASYNFKRNSSVLIKDL